MLPRLKLILRVLGLSSPWTCVNFRNISVPVSSISNRVVDFQRVRWIYRVSCHNASSSFGGKNSFVRSIAGLISSRQLLLNAGIGNNRQDPSSHILTVILHRHNFLVNDTSLEQKVQGHKPQNQDNATPEGQR